ncbi:hypothetical protein ACFLS4_04775 [Bacteroidota bacterium]
MNKKKSNIMYKSKYIVLILSVLLFACNNLDISNDQSKSFIKFLSPSNSNIGKDVIQYGDGFVVLATVTSEKLNTEIVRYQIDQYGNIKTDGVDTLSPVRGGNNTASKLMLTSDGGFIVTGTVEDTVPNIINETNNNIYIEKFNSSFTSEWVQIVGTDDNEECGSIKGDYSGYIVVGSTDAAATNNPRGNKDVYLIKLDAAGNIEWTENHGGEGDEYASDVVAIDGGYLLVGTTNELHGDARNDDQILVIETNYVGGSPDNAFYGSDKNDYGATITKIDTGGYIITGSVEDAGNNFNVYAVKVGEDIHDVIWTENYGTTQLNDQGFDMVRSNGGFIIVGTYGLPSGPAAYFLKIGGESEILNEHAYGGYGQIIYAIEPTYDGGFIMTGSSGPEGNEKIYLIKVNSEGEL